MTHISSSSDLLARLRGVLIKQRAVMFAAGLVVTVAAAVAVAVVLSLLAHVMVLPVWLKVSLIVAAALVTAGLFVRYALVRLFEGDVDRVAVELEKRHPELKGRLIAAVQFTEYEQSPGFSSELIKANEEQALQQAGLVNFNRILSFHPVLTASRLLAGATVIAVALLVFAPGFFSYSYEVYSNPTTEIAPPLAYQLTATPGSVEWIKYRDLTIGGALSGLRMPEEAAVHYRLAGGGWQRQDIDLRTANRVSGMQGDSLSFGFTLRQINKSLDYYVEAGRLKTETMHIDVVDRPRVTDIELAIFYPEYTGLAPTTIKENNGSFSAVTGSRVNLTVTTNLPVETAELVFEDSSRVPLDVDQLGATASLVVENSRSYHIRLKNHLNEVNPDPIEYYITSVPDEYPSIDVVRPGFDANLSDEMILPLTVRIFDDYGFSSLVMKYNVVSSGRISDENVVVLHYSEKIKTEGEVSLNWDMDRLNLFPGDYVSYYFEVADNDVIGGPKVSGTRRYIARLPSLEELIAETEEDNRVRITETERLLQRGKEIADRLKNAARKLNAQKRGEKQADWQQRKEIESIAENNEELVDDIQKTAEQMDQAVEKLKQDALMSREIVEKLEQIQKLFKEVATPEMREAQQKLMEALQNMDREQIQQAMKDFEMSQEELMDRLERQLALLKKMQLEQKMEAMLRKAEQILERQDNMNEKSESSDTESLPQMQSSEEEIKESLEQLQKETADLREMLEQPEMGDVPEAEQFAEALEKTDAGQDMQNMARSLGEKKQQQSVKQGKQASSKLSKMVNQMQQQMMAMKGNDSEQIKRAMRRAIEDAGYISEQEEELLKQVAALSPQSTMLRELAGSQQDLMNACTGLQNTISELGKSSPFVAAELQSLVNQATTSMGEALEQFGNRRTTKASQAQREAMVNLNTAALRMMESLEEQRQCDKGGQCDKPMAKLESMCNKQNNLNQQTQNQCNSNPQPSDDAQRMGQREALKRLAGEQGAIRKSMEELEREFGGSRQILGRLSDIADEMKKIEESLEAGQSGPEISERQLKVYSRMLEASRSLQRRDFNDQRKAATAGDMPAFVPPALPADLLQNRDQFEDRLRRFLGSEYPAQYEEQIKAYFRALMQTQNGAAPIN